MSGKTEKKDQLAVEAETESKSRHAIKLFDFEKDRLKPTKVEKGENPVAGPFRRPHYDYQYDDGERDLLEVRHPDYEECYISRNEELKDGKLIVAYSVTVYFDVEKDKEAVAANQAINAAVLACVGSVKSELDFGQQKYSKKKFDPDNYTDLWYDMIREVEDKPKRRKMKFKTAWKGQKPHLKRFLSPKEREAIAKEKGVPIDKAPKTEELDADMFLGGKCLKLRIRSQHPKTHAGEKLWPQSIHYSSVVLGVTNKGKVPEDLDDDQYDDIEASHDLDALALEMAKIKAQPIDLQAGKKKKKDKDGEKDKGVGDVKAGAAKVDETEKVQDALAKLKERKQKEMAEKKKSPKKDDEEEEDKEAEETAKKEKKSKKKKSPKKDEEDE